MRLQVTMLDPMKKMAFRYEGWVEATMHFGGECTFVWDTDKKGWPKEPTWKA